MSSIIEPDTPLVTEERRPTRASTWVVRLYAIGVYVLFLAVLAYAVGFFAGVGVPKDIDEGPRVPVPVAVGVDLVLLSLFAAQHTVMARPWFKRRWTQVVPESAERATFVLAASLTLALLFWLWRPIDGTVWTLAGPAAGALWAAYATGWVVTVGSTFLISHGDLFGLRQAWQHARPGGYEPPPFTEGRVYGRVRHPLMLGFLIVFWSTPTMTAGHLLFAAASTGYVLVGIAFEEHDLTQSLGGAYTAYRARVPALVPRLSRRPPASDSPRCEDERLEGR